MLTFEETAHQYFWHGKPVPNVTRVIGHLTDYSHIPPERLRVVQDEGKAIHKMVELDAKGTLEKVPEWLKGRFEALCRFKEETGAECWYPERRMFHPTLGYAGTGDWFGLLPKLPKLKGPTNLDVKRSLYGGPAIGLQLTGYTEQWNALEGRDLRMMNRGALVLNDNGTYRITIYNDPEDRAAFLACLQQIRWREKHYGIALRSAA